MTTLADSLVSTISTNYGGGGGGGTTPANIINLVDYTAHSPLVPSAEYIVVWQPYPAQRNGWNDVLVDVIYELRVRILTPTSDDRLKEINDEVISVIEANTISGINYQRVIGIDDLTDRRVPIYAKELTCKFFRVLVDAAVNYSATSSSHTHDDRYYTETEVDALVGRYAFKTITGITNDVVADGIEDTLTLASSNNILAITGTTATDTITFAIDESNIDHDALTNFSATEHFTMLNEDDMASDSDTQAATQQSIKAYVDAQVGSENEINELNDVILAGPATNDVLVYHAVDSSWHDLSPAEYAALINASISHDSLADVSADDHHTKYTDAEVEAIITAELVNGQSIDNAIDALITTHTGVAAAHHAKYTSTDLETDLGITVAGLLDGMPYGSANASQVVCIPSGSNPAFGVATWRTLGIVSNTDGTDFDMTFLCPLPTSKGALKLYITDLDIEVIDADADDYINQVYVYSKNNGTTQLFADGTNLTSIQAKNYDFGGPIDCSGYDYIFVYIINVVTTSGDLDYEFPRLTYYYA